MDTELLIIDDESEIIIEVDTDVEVLEVAAQGPRGPQGVPGPIADLNGAFLVTNRFGEIAADETAKQAARANIGLAVIDGGTFF